MKQHHLLLMLSFVGVSLTASECSISVQPQWQSLERSNTKAAQFGGKWILIGTITFRKKCREAIKLSQLALAWHGPAITHLTGSLYKKIPSKDFAPIEDNLLNDGSWDNEKQEFTFDFFHQSQTLGPISTFYVVLTVPDQVEPLLKQGYFSIIKQQLPELFDEHIKTAQLNLTLN